MGDFIERKDVMAAMARLVPKNQFPIMLKYGDIVDAIMEIPSAGEELMRTGKWERFRDENGNKHYRCSVCGMPAIINVDDEDDTSFYCPECGAKMDQSTFKPIEGRCHDCANVNLKARTGLYPIESKECPYYRGNWSCWVSKEEKQDHAKDQN